MSSESKSEQELQEKVRRHAIWAVTLHNAGAAKAGLNASDAQALNLLQVHGMMTPGRLAEAMSLTTGGSITALIDRLEKAGMVRRVRDAADRRRVLVEVVEEKAEALLRQFLPVNEAAWERLSGYTEEERQVLIRFFDDVHENVPSILADLRALP
ncbi:MarR family winged helix-turn-helix transcriptional regulator [Actinocorallia aurantiaca]|uniref:MarR family transcriptional regulator n=1 Tax=Actinocorallia aurantiaca TaxID=46204 RepID=A0ABN3UM09_9ACTN